MWAWVFQLPLCVLAGFPTRRSVVSLETLQGWTEMLQGWTETLPSSTFSLRVTIQSCELWMFRLESAGPDVSLAVNPQLLLLSIPAIFTIHSITEIPA